MSLKKYTVEEVSKHKSANDLWMALHGKVYNLTKFLKEHPGGEEVLLNLAGEDGTTCFDDIGHSQEAKQLKDSLAIGELEGFFTKTDVRKETSTLGDDEEWAYEESKKESSLYQLVFIPLGVLVYAVLFYYMFYHS